MNQIDAILDARRRLGSAAGAAVLVTVVHVTGSAYRRPGARMLVLPDGRRIGSISGGCLEGDVSRKAWWLTEEGRPAVRVYDTTSEDDAVWEFGLGCNGVVHVLFERLDAADEVLSFIAGTRAARERGAVATIVGVEDTRLRLGTRLLVGARGIAGGELAGSTLEAHLCHHAAGVLRQRRSRFVRLDGCDVFVELIEPPVPLVVFGGGHDAIPVVAMAKQLGWHVTVADGRPAYASPDRFPGADRVVLLRRQGLRSGIEIGPESVVLMMTHNFPLDCELLPAILEARPLYLGLLGPARRAERLFVESGAERRQVDVHAPVGLDIGGDGAEAIALSIVAEIQATLSRRAGGELRRRGSPIHARVEEHGAPSPARVPEGERLSCDLANGHA
jgi:xanthine/CO dehydrogenase XdhC/CoxF family maturation factor